MQMRIGSRKSEEELKRKNDTEKNEQNLLFVPLKNNHVPLSMIMSIVKKMIVLSTFYV